MPGEKAVASYDEDSVTMAVEAGIDCLTGMDRSKIDAVYLASTTLPYKEKLSAAIVAAALDLPAQVRAADFTNTLRAGTIALRAALDAVTAGSARQVLVIIADSRLGAPSGVFEATVGDGAAALLVGNTKVVAEIQHSHTKSDEFSGVWRADGDIYLRTWEDRMVLDQGYSAILPETMSELMQESGLTAQDFTKTIYNAPMDVRRHIKLGPQLGFSAEQVQDSMFMNVGNTGAAQAPMMLVAALEQAKPGDRYIFGNYGDGADVFVIEATKAVKRLKQRRGIQNHLESKRLLNSYGTFIRWRKSMFLEPPRWPDPPPTSIAALHRDRQSILRLYGKVCTNCGTPVYEASPGRVCVECQAKDQFEPYPFADKKSRIVTFSLDQLSASDDPPSAVVVVDFEGGGRGLFDMTDRDPDAVEVGMAVEMTFRKLNTDRGIHNYWWKVRPERC